MSDYIIELPEVRDRGGKVIQQRKSYCYGDESQIAAAAEHYSKLTVYGGANNVPEHIRAKIRNSRSAASDAILCDICGVRRW